MMNDFNGHSWGMGLGMGWWWIIGIAVVTAIIWFILRNANSSRLGNSKEKSALDILKERFAKGEINKEEYEERRKKLI
jgi:putative membrane protein